MSVEYWGFAAWSWLFSVAGQWYLPLFINSELILQKALYISRVANRPCGLLQIREFCGLFCKLLSMSWLHDLINKIVWFLFFCSVFSASVSACFVLLQPLVSIVLSCHLPHSVRWSGSSYAVIQLRWWEDLLDFVCKFHFCCFSFSICLLSEVCFFVI